MVSGSTQIPISGFYGLDIPQEMGPDQILLPLAPLWAGGSCSRRLSTLGFRPGSEGRAARPLLPLTPLPGFAVPALGVFLTR